MIEMIMNKTKLQLAKALPLWGQITTRGQVAQGVHQKRAKEPLTIYNREEAKVEMKTLK